MISTPMNDDRSCCFMIDFVILDYVPHRLDDGDGPQPVADVEDVARPFVQTSTIGSNHTV